MCRHTGGAGEAIAGPVPSTSKEVKGGFKNTLWTQTLEPLLLLATATHRSTNNTVCLWPSSLGTWTCLPLFCIFFDQANHLTVQRTFSFFPAFCSMKPSFYSFAEISPSSSSVLIMPRGICKARHKTSAFNFQLSSLLPFRLTVLTCLSPARVCTNFSMHWNLLKGGETKSDRKKQDNRSYLDKHTNLCS